MQMLDPQGGIVGGRDIYEAGAQGKSVGHQEGVPEVHSGSAQWYHSSFLFFLLPSLVLTEQGIFFF